MWTHRCAQREGRHRTGLLPAEACTMASLSQELQEARKDLLAEGGNVVLPPRLESTLVAPDRARTAFSYIQCPVRAISFQGPWQVTQTAARSSVGQGPFCGAQAQPRPAVITLRVSPPRKHQGAGEGGEATRATWFMVGLLLSGSSASARMSGTPAPRPPGWSPASFPTDLVTRPARLFCPHSDHEAGR